jgi:hypothetical protein
MLFPSLSPISSTESGKEGAVVIFRARAASTNVHCEHIFPEANVRHRAPSLLL